MASQFSNRGRDAVSYTAARASGLPLAAALQAGTTLIKPSLRELREVLRQPLEHPADQCAAAQALVHSGQTEMVALSLGAQGAVLATRDGVWQAPALDVSAARGTTGAGDCFLAALVWALDRGDAPADALRWGVAAGAAALLHPGTTLAQADDVLAHVKVVDLLKSLPRVGEKRATAVMEKLDIAPNRRIRGLGRHQVAGLKAEFK